MSPEERAQFEEMKTFIQALKNAATIPYEVDASFRDRLGLQGGVISITVSSKNADSEDETTSDLGGEVVLGDPVGFLETEIEGTTYYIPYYSA